MLFTSNIASSTAETYGIRQTVLELGERIIEDVDVGRGKLLQKRGRGCKYCIVLFDYYFVCS